jgi:hypothetical protein
MQAFARRERATLVLHNLTRRAMAELVPQT